MSPKCHARTHAQTASHRKARCTVGTRARANRLFSRAFRGNGFPLSFSFLHTFNSLPIIFFPFFPFFWRQLPTENKKRSRGQKARKEAPNALSKTEENSKNKTKEIQKWGRPERKRERLGDRKKIRRTRFRRRKKAASLLVLLVFCFCFVPRLFVLSSVGFCCLRDPSSFFPFWILCFETPSLFFVSPSFVGAAAVSDERHCNDSSFRFGN